MRKFLGNLADCGSEEMEIAQKKKTIDGMHTELKFRVLERFCQSGTTFYSCLPGSFVGAWIFIMFGILQY